jgi:hypothetical protein
MADFSRARENSDRLKQRREQHSHAVVSPRSLGNKMASLLHITTGHKETRRDAQKLASALKERRYSPAKQVELSLKLDHDKLKATSGLSIGDLSPMSTFTELTELTSPSSSPREILVRRILDEEDESEQATLLGDLDGFLIWEPSKMADFSRARENSDRLKKRREQHSHAVVSPRSLGNKMASLLHITAGHKSRRDAQKLANAFKERRYSPVKQHELSSSGELSICDRSPTSTFTEPTESARPSSASSPSSSSSESLVRRIVLDEEDESEQATVGDLEEFLIKRQLSDVVEDYEALTVSINTAGAGGSSWDFQEKDYSGQDAKGQRQRPRVQRKALTRSNKGQRERPRAQRTPSVKSKKVEAERKKEDYFQGDKIQQDRQRTGERVGMSYSRSLDEDTLDEVDAHIDGAARLQEMYGEDVDKQRQQDMLGLSMDQNRSAGHKRECRNRRFMQNKNICEHEMKGVDLDHIDRRDALRGVRADIAAMRKQGKDKDGSRRWSRRANQLSIIDDCESEASSAQDDYTGPNISGELTVKQSNMVGETLSEQRLSEDESVESVEFRFCVSDGTDFVH